MNHTNFDKYYDEYDYIINTKMTLEQKKELLLQLIIKLDEEPNKIFRKKIIIQIQRMLYILDNII